MSVHGFFGSNFFGKIKGLRNSSKTSKGKQLYIFDPAAMHHIMVKVCEPRTTDLFSFG